jgi:hypothetical protein
VHDGPTSTLSILLHIEFEQAHLPKSRELIGTVVVKVPNVWLKISYFLDKLQNKDRWFLRIHEGLHQICEDICVLLLQQFWQVTEVAVYILVGMPDNKKFHSDLLENTPGCKQWAESHDKSILVVLRGVVKLKVESFRKGNNWTSRG